MTLDPVLLSRLQFFWVISFHILLPAFTVGLACYIAVLESLYLKTGDHTYFRVSVFWTKIFAVSFGLGVVSGIVMPFQFGTNWSRFSDAAANVIGPLMAYEGLTAFFLEASFLGVLSERKLQRISLGDQINRLERVLIENALAEHHGNATLVCRTLRIPKRTLYDKMRKLGLSTEEYHASDTRGRRS